MITLFFLYVLTSTVQIMHTVFVVALSTLACNKTSPKGKNRMLFRMEKSNGIMRRKNAFIDITIVESSLFDDKARNKSNMAFIHVLSLILHIKTHC